MKNKYIMPKGLEQRSSIEQTVHEEKLSALKLI